MNKESPVPRLREDLEIIPTSYQGERAVVVRDFLGLIRDPIVIQGDALNLLGLIDGKRTVRDIQLELVRFNQGVLVDAELISRIVAELDSAHLLQSRKCQEEKERILNEYAGLKIRRASHAGVSYPAQPDKLLDYLDSILNDPEVGDGGRSWSQIVGLVAPHIDLEIGRKTYARAYRAIRDQTPQRIFLLGTGHSHSEGFFCLTEKDFETPFGRVETDRAAVRALRRAGDSIVSAHDISHRREHSLEFQLLFLQRLFGQSFSLVPVLCGSFSGELGKVSRPSEIPAVGRFLAALRSLWEEDGGHGLVVAGVDFSHIGPKFGHRERAATLLGEAKNHDLKLIDALSRGDVLGFWGEARRVGDRYNVCGLSALATLLELLPEARGHTLDYDVWNEAPTQSAVSYAALVLAAD
jgi:AmmeMemoRadiSam system protein B